MGREFTTSKRRRDVERERCIKKVKVPDKHCTIYRDVSARGHFKEIERKPTPKFVDQTSLDDFEHTSHATAALGDEEDLMRKDTALEETQEEAATQVRLISHRHKY